MLLCHILYSSAIYLGGIETQDVNRKYRSDSPQAFFIVQTVHGCIGGCWNPMASHAKVAEKTEFLHTRGL